MVPQYWTLHMIFRKIVHRVRP